VTILAEESGYLDLARLMSCYAQLTNWLDATRLLGVRRECGIACDMSRALLLQGFAEGVRRKGLPVEQLQ